MIAPIAETPFVTIADCVRRHASQRPDATALVDDERALSWAELDALMDRVAAALQRDGVRAGEAIALCAMPSVLQAALFLGALRAGVVVAPLAPGSTSAVLARMLGDAQARRLFVDAGTQAEFAETEVATTRIDGDVDAWLAPPGTRPADVDMLPESPFNII